MILVVSYPDENHTDEVLRHLRASGRDVRSICLADFPTQAAIECEWAQPAIARYTVSDQCGRFDLGDVSVAWWRRITAFRIDSRVGRPIERAFSESETSQAVHGVLDAIDCAWINPRAADEAAHRKPLQWATALRVGLKLPRTLVTNDPTAARRFIEQVGVGRTVFKAFLAATEEWRETRLIEASDLDRIDAVQFAPVIFQEYIAGVDLRITVVGDRLYSAEIDASRTSYPVDMRMVIGEAAIRPIDLPSEIADSLLRLMNELGIVYGAIDMRRTKDGEYLFLEVNPAGQWLFVEQRTGLPISKAVADLLGEYDDRHYTRKR